MYKKTVVFEFILMLEDGGAQALVKDYALLLNKDKFDVHVITLWKIPGAINSDILRENGINDIGIYNGMTFFNRAFNKLCGWFFPALKLKFLIWKYKPDCLHFHLNLAKYVKQATRKDRNIRLFYTSHAEPEVNFDSPKEIKTVDWLIKNKNLKVIALHNKMKWELDEIFGISDTIVLHNGINIARFTDVKEKKSDIRQMLGIPEKAHVIGCVARFCKVKNHSFLIDVFA
ncbi:MAG: glycosyltransferase family 4 protein, partial [Sphaerochaetaceae bacterium]|nr:glycosyltransferase family 4 protein [Sphaerochaetaceae bacterium]